MAIGAVPRPYGGMGESVIPMGVAENRLEATERIGAGLDIFPAPRYNGAREGSAVTDPIRKILVDADACPVVDITLQLAAAAGVPVILLCDTAHRLERPGARTVMVDKGADSVDLRLVNLVTPGDIVVTQDYGLAAMCLAKGAQPVHQNGILYTNNNIDELLYARYIGKKLRRAGHRTKGPPPRTKAQDEAFAAALAALLQGKNE